MDEISEPHQEDELSDEEIRIFQEYIYDAIVDSSIENRKRVLGNAFLNHGHRFVRFLALLKNDEDADATIFDLVDHSQKLFTSFIAGNKISERSDENERRVHILSELARQNPQFKRLFIKALSDLPENHLMRDLKLIKQSLLDLKEVHKKVNKYEDQLLVIAELIKLESKDTDCLDLIAEGTSLVPLLNDFSESYNFYVAVISNYLNIIQSDDTQPIERTKIYSDKAYKLIRWMKNQFQKEFAETSGINLYATVMSLCNKEEEAIENFAATVDNSKPNELSYQTAAIIESRFRWDTQQYERIIKILTPAIPYLEEKYLLSVEETDITDKGETYCDAVWNLAFAHAYVGNWSKAFEFLERGKSRRLLYQANIRKTKNGDQLLDLEKKLYILNRKIEFEENESNKKNNWLSEKLSLKTKILEEYRQQRKKLNIKLVTPTLKEISSLLADDEAVVSIGVIKRGGTMLILVCKDNEEIPSGIFIDKEMNYHTWVPFFAGENEDGWLYALDAPELNIDHKSALTHLLEGVDKLIGEPLKKLLDSKNIKHVTIIPHLWFHSIPFWALASLDEFEISIAGSATHFIESRNTTLKSKKNVLVVSNPTLDLPCSGLEADLVRAHMESGNFKVNNLEREKATEKNIVNALDEVSIFHFCGHGRSEMDNPTKSSLMVAIDENDGRFNKTDPFSQLLKEITEWKNLDEGNRGAQMPGIGYFFEKRSADGNVQERILEIGESTSLLGLYYNGQLENLMEMWSAGDIMIQQSLSKCSLAFLSACEAGVGSLSIEIDEYSGLPSALQLAGVKTVICSLWPVEDILATLYVDLFYNEFSQLEGLINLTSLVKKINNKIRTLPLEETLEILNYMKSKTDDITVKDDIDYYISTLKEEDKKFPFAHPVEWASFYVIGSSYMDYSD
jgi:CHAT domain-containing protein